MLGDTEGVIDGAPFRFAVPDGRSLDVRCRDFGDRFSPFGREFLNVLEKGLTLCSALIDEGFVLVFR